MHHKCGSTRKQRLSPFIMVGEQDSSTSLFVIGVFLFFFWSAVCLSVVVVDTETMIECNEQRMLQADLRLLLNAAVIKTLAHHLPLQLL